MVALTFALLTASLLSLWLPPSPSSVAQAANPRSNVPSALTLRPHLWLLLFLAATITALLAGIVRPLGLLWLILFAAAVQVFVRSSSSASPRTTATAAAVAIIVLAASLMAHVLPGFNNPRVISDLCLTPDALPYRLHLNFDKTAVGLLLLALLHPRLTRAADWRSMLRIALPIAAATVAALLLLSLAFGYVRFAPKLPPETPLFLWANLCLTCVAEEAFFRGFLQRQLTLRWQHHPRGATSALFIAALLFGLAHAAGGPVYVALSTLAGLGYGLAYQRTGHRLEAAILTHFSVNALHFLLFTYPALRSLA